MEVSLASAIATLDSLPDGEFRGLMRSCCASQRYVDEMAARRPFREKEFLFATSKQVWFALNRGDWLEAFAAHPRIGGLKKDKDDDRFKKWSESEQAGVSSADNGLLSELAKLNDDYYQKHGFVFLICASGKSALEMTEKLRERITKDTDTEIDNAAHEQVQITEIRLRKALGELVQS